MKIILGVFGSVGDVRPALALSLALRKAGHEPIICAPPNFRDLFSQSELPFYPIAFDSRKMMEEELKKITNPVKFYRMLNKFQYSFTWGQFNDLVKVAENGADLIMATGLCIGSTVADYLKIPFRYYTSIPNFFVSKYHVPVNLPVQKLPKCVNIVLWKLSRLAFKRFMGKYISKIRVLHKLREGNYLNEESILCADRDLVQMPADVRQKYTQVGYWHLNEETELDAELVQFIEKGPAPIYIGFGSMTDGSPDKTKEILQKLIDLQRFRLVISKGWAKLGVGVDDNENVYLVDNVPHLKLFPKMALIIHHGGSGTVNAAARSGIPQIIVPHIMDQFYWGRLIYELKIGPRPIPRTRLTFKKLLGAIEEVMAGKDIQNNAEQLGEKLRKSDGIKDTIAIIEAIDKKILS